LAVRWSTFTSPAPSTPPPFFPAPYFNEHMPKVLKVLFFFVLNKFLDSVILSVYFSTVYKSLARKSEKGQNGSIQRALI
jgi:hypothetical protein